MGLSYKSTDFLVSDAEAVKPPRLASHVHKYFEFLRFIDGGASYIAGSETCILEKGDIVVTHPNTLHTISLDASVPYSRQFIQLSPQFLLRIPSSLVRNIINDKFSEMQIIHKNTAEQFELYRFYDECIRLLLERTEKNKFFASLLLQQFAVSVNEAIGAERHLTETSEESPALSRLKAWLDENYAENITLDEMAKIFSMSKYYICHLFKEEAGVTVSDYIALKRIDAVRSFVNEGGAITDIYRRCGFNDYSSFYRTVKNYTGMKPSEFYG